MSSSKKKRQSRKVEIDPEARERLEGVIDEDALDRALEGLDPGQITGPGGLITQLAGRVISTALDAEMDDHLGRPPGSPAPDGNHRNGAIPKTVATELGDVRIDTPRDRDGSFEPKLVAKRQTRLAGLDDRVIGLYAGGMSVREISRQLSDLYGTEIGKDQVSRITDRVLEDVQAWRHRPLEEIYPILYLDALMVKITTDRSVQKQACYLAVGVNLDGERECLGMWWQETEGAKFWLAVLNDLKQRGIDDVLICCVDGLAGFEDAIEAVFPKAWVQTCVVHQIRNSMNYVAYQDRKPVARDLRPIYTAPKIEAAEQALTAFEGSWNEKYPMISESWRERWDLITPFLALPADLRKIVYTTNSIEALNRQIRKTIKTRGHFPTQDAASKLIYLAITRAENGWRNVHGWTRARTALKIHFKDRMPDNP